MRLYWSRPSHRQVLQGLGLTQRELPIVGLARRDSAGRPVEFVERFSIQIAATKVLEQFERRFMNSAQEPAPVNRLGVLLVLDPAAPNGEAVRQEFLQELGLLLQEQQGGLKPDFPLMHYDLSIAGHAAYVDKLGISRGRAPLAVVTEFSGNLPVRLVDRGGSLNTPALTSRRLLATLKTAKVSGVSSLEDAPAPSEVVYTSEGLVISVVRLHQLAKQLYEVLRNQPPASDEKARQDLLGIVENAGIVREQMKSGNLDPDPSMHRLLLNIADFRSSSQQLRFEREEQRQLLKNLLEVLVQVDVAHRQLLGR